MTDNRTTELLPCPFCGSNKAYPNIELGKHWVECRECTAESGDYRTKAEAIAAWNTRAELGSGTCEVIAQTWEDRGGDEEDTYKYELSCGHTVRMLDCESLHNCPRCGKAVR